MTLMLTARIDVNADKARQETAALTGEVGRLKTGMAGAGTTALAMGNSHRIAAGSVGNLAANVNDVAMMALAGQNPLQLAIQQGTQIGQVFGPMGAGDAAEA